MRRVFQKVYHFLPVQLLLLHFRKYQLMLLFWLILFLTLSGNFATTFGAASLFLAPEYLGSINMMSMLLLGAATAIFIMSWNITTFIIHSQRIPFLGATRHSFLKYCINNAFLPIIYLIFYSTVCTHYLWVNEHTPITRILLLQAGFYLGATVVLFISFVYFFRVDKDLFKIVLSRITNPSLIREIVPYDSLDEESDIIRADTFISNRFAINKVKDLKAYHPRLMNIVLRMHHRNAITATFFSLLLLIALGMFVDQPRLRIPAGASFLILFSVIMGLVGAVKYFLKTWELMGWIIIGSIISLLVKYSLFSIGSTAFGLDYEQARPAYQYDSLRKMITTEACQQDIHFEQQRLDNWLLNNTDSVQSKPTLVVLATSGGGSRSAYWTFRSLQYLDSISQGKLFKSTVLLTGASGGMIGATYWHGLHTESLKGSLSHPYAYRYQENIGKDLLNAIIFSFASLDIISPFNKIAISGKSYNRDRGYAMEQELIRNTEGILDKRLGDDAPLILQGLIPNIIINGTIINDGRNLMMSSQPLRYLMSPLSARVDSATPPIDAIDFGALYRKQQPMRLLLTTALRMNATFPYILPAVKLPSVPEIDVMDAGLRDNFGVELLSRYLLVHKEWMQQHVGNIIFLQIRDTKENEVFPFSEEKSLGSLLTAPLFVIQNKWEPFQSYTQGYIKDLLPLINKQIHMVTLTYIPRVADKSASLNFHITQREKEDLYKSIYNPQNQTQVQHFLELLNQP